MPDEFTQADRDEAAQIAADLVRDVMAAQLVDEALPAEEWRENARTVTATVLGGLAAQERRVHGDTRAAATLDLIAAAVEQGR